ncbi:MAG: response regulator [Atopobiaceae bacterium]|nr:response regulator [Atopobiaceae bacterium]
MVTLTADDNVLVAQALVRTLASVDPSGTHLLADSGRVALDIARKQPLEVAFLDVEMPDVSGLDVAQQLRDLQADCDVIFVTGHEEYALQAFGLYASAYLLKPVTENRLRDALSHLRHQQGLTKDLRGTSLSVEHQTPQACDVPADSKQVGKRLQVQCFGFFEVWCDGVPVHFRRTRAKALLAYLIDRNGAMCNTPQLVNALWPENPSNVTYANQLRVFISDLQTTLTRLGLGDVLLRTHGHIGIDRDRVSCDYYDYLAGDEQARRRFHGEYMSQYDFGEPTLAAITHALRWRA